ncbi:Uncharacterised protein [Serratia quinivorans]|uniref:Uncharacterized protein n=1 Tax=Serratia quinivorans TaxID=137545 RepID=A0A380ATB1_9GAMM|nr:hypothetical protein [Serratia proteamaculans]RYM59995.1 hypothetical protein BSR03_16200 [Serratia proteamaculans]SUI86042.1 Uncharacterised protein [Serratia quinivorans]
MKVTETKVQSIEITEVERLDPIRVMAENYEPGQGRITITCYGKAWTSAWFAMGGDTVQAFFIRVSNDYLIGNFAPQMQSEVDDDNDANTEFVKSEICKLRRSGEIEQDKARDMWDTADCSEDVKGDCCACGRGSVLFDLLGDDTYYANWPTVPNHEYQYLERILDAVREALKQVEVRDASK